MKDVHRGCGHWVHVAGWPAASHHRTGRNIDHTDINITTVTWHTSIFVTDGYTEYHILDSTSTRLHSGSFKLYALFLPTCTVLVLDCQLMRTGSGQWLSRLPWLPTATTTTLQEGSHFPQLDMVAANPAPRPRLHGSSPSVCSTRSS